MKRTLLAIALLALMGCQGKGELAMVGQSDPEPEPSTDTQDTQNSDTPTTTPEPTTIPEPQEGIQLPVSIEPPEMTGDETVFYLRRISQMLVGRTLTMEEVSQATAEGDEALRPILESWVAEAGFSTSIRYMLEQKLKASGERDGIDFDAPGRLVEHTVSNQLPMSTILKADYCIGTDGQQGDCDSGAPYNAGVLTTRAFLAGNASRFNLGRASRMMKVFACRAYPMEDDLQPRLEKESLIEMFRAQSAEEQTVEEAKDAFGNGDACYTCHGQFSAHAQFYVKFNENGQWIDEATGIQDPEGELGRSLNGLMTSHMLNDVAKADEGSDMFGKRANNLGEAAAIIADSDVFVPCMVRNVIEHTFGMTDSAGEEIDRTLLEAVAYRATNAGTTEPTMGTVVVETFIDPRVVAVVLETQNGGAQ